MMGLQYQMLQMGLYGRVLKQVLIAITMMILQILLLMGDFITGLP